jgi:hypothetical protein
MKKLIISFIFIMSFLCNADTNEPTRYATITNSVFSNGIIVVNNGRIESEEWGESVVYIKTNVFVLKMASTNGTKWYTFSLMSISKIEGIDDRCSSLTIGRGTNVTLVTLLNSDVKKVMYMKKELWKRRNPK